MACLGAGAAQPRIAIWDPVTSGTENRFHLDLAGIKQISDWLQQGGTAATRLTADQIADPASFSSGKYDGVLFLGSAFPRSTLGALKKFSDEGGVLIDLDAEVPFLIAIAPGPGGVWDLAPAQPRFAWQNSELLTGLGLKDDYQQAKLQDQGINHLATPLLKHYLPEAVDLHGRLPGRWIVPLAASKGTPGEIYPLIRSQRSDGAEVPPQLYVVRAGSHSAILSAGNLYTSDAAPSVWPCGRQTVCALAVLARDLRAGSVNLQADMPAEIKAKNPLPLVPLDTLATGSIDPEHAQAVIRWGRFDGSSMEFGPVLAANKSLDIPADAKPADFPRALESGASVKLALPQLSGGPLYLRVRGAYMATGAALEAKLGQTPILNESFVYIDTSGASNLNHNLVGVPTEFTRIAFIPPPAAAATTLTLTNPGRNAIYFDAMQIERRSQPAPERWIGLGAGYGMNYSRDLSGSWSAIRLSLRTNLAGPPGDPNRFAKMDELFNKIAALNDTLQPILEGTPSWCAISPERLDEAEKAKRPQACPPDPVKYAQLVADVIGRYGNRVGSYEIWNEPEFSQFYRGTSEEYATLVKTVIPVIRKLAPSAKILTYANPGINPPFLQKMIEAGIPQMADLVVVHPYSGKSPGWDVPYEQVQGHLMAHGITTEIYCNESGFPWNNAEWFKAPPVITPQVQRDLLNVAMARLLACGLCKLNVFNAGGDDSPYGLIDQNGKPRSAYSVFADYALLARKGARRTDVNMTEAAGAVLQGVYAVASSYDDGSVTIVINPAQSNADASAARGSGDALAVHLCVPLTKSLSPNATVTAEGQPPATVPVVMHDQPNDPWAELTLSVKDRTIVQLRPISVISQPAP